MTTNVARLAHLLDAIDTHDASRSGGPGDNARFVAAFLDDDGDQVLAADLAVTLRVDLATWALHHGCGTPEETRAHFAHATHPEAIADGLNQLEDVQIDGVGYDVTAMERSQVTAAAQPKAGAASVSRGVVYVDRVVRVAVDQATWSNAEGTRDPLDAQRDLAQYVDNALTAVGGLVPLVEERDGTVTVMPVDDVQARDERGDWWTCSLHGGAVTQDCACSGAAGTGNLAVAAQALWEAGHPGGDWHKTDSATRRYVEQRVRLVIEAYHAAPAAG